MVANGDLTTVAIQRSNTKIAHVKLAISLPLRHNPAMETAVVQCPTCFETFEVVMPSPDELPTEYDYDCEICCRPMVIIFDEEGGAFARGLGE